MLLGMKRPLDAGREARAAAAAQAGGLDHVGHFLRLHVGDGLLEGFEAAVLFIDIQLVDVGNVTVTEEKVSHYFTSLPLFLQGFDQFHGLIHGHVLVIFDALRALELEHGRPVAAGQAGDRFERDQAIRGGLADLDAQVAAQFLQELVRAAQGAGQVGADLHAIFASLLVMVERVKTDDLGHIGGGDIQHLGDIFHRSFGDITVLALRQVKQRHDRRAFLLRRILCQDLLYFLRIFFSKHKSSHSPHPTLSTSEV